MTEVCSVVEPDAETFYSQRDGRWLGSTPPRYTSLMPCDHLGPPDIIDLAEQTLRARNIPENEWPGLRVHHGENLVDGMWASVVIEIERRGRDWIVTKLDRNADPISESEVGLKVLGK